MGADAVLVVQVMDVAVVAPAASQASQSLRTLSRFYGIGQRGSLSHLRRENRSVAVSSGHPVASLVDSI